MELTHEEFQSGIESVKKYFDEETAEMKSYVDEKNAELEENLKSYVNEKNTEQTQELKSYVDDKISGVIFYVDEKTHELKNCVDEKFAGVQTQIQNQIQRLDTNDKVIAAKIEGGNFAASLSVGAVAAIAGMIILSPLFREIFAGVRKFFTRPKEDLNVRISELEKKILALSEKQGA